MNPVRKKNSSSSALAGVFLAVGALLLLSSMYSQMQIAAFIGLGLVFWGAIFAAAKSGKYIESTLLDGAARSTYSTIDRMVNDLKYNGQAYYIPAYPSDISLPEYLQNLREPVAFISDNFDGKISVDELAAGKFLSAKNRGIFVTAPGSSIVAQLEQRMQLDFSKMNLTELTDMLPKCMTEMFNLAKNAEMTTSSEGANFRATGILYESLYHTQTRLRSVNMLGCPVVSAVASALAKTSSKIVVIEEQTLTPNCSVNVIFKFI